MKKLILLVFLIGFTVFSNTDYTGRWTIKTLGASNKADITQRGSEITVFRVLKIEFEGKEEDLYHLMKGELTSKNLKLYVKEEDFDKFEFLRNVGFEIIDNNTIKIDGKLYQRKPVAARKKEENKIEIIYLDKNKVAERKKVEGKKDIGFLLPAGLGDKSNRELREIKISSGFTSEESALNMKAFRLLKRKHYDKAIKIFSKLYKKNPKNVSLLIKLENAYSLKGDKKQAEIYCKKIKKYDPYYLCGD